MKIPKSVRINGMEYAIDYVKDLNDGRRVLKGQVELGRHVIHINPTEENDQQDKCLTFLHEIFHAICYEYNIDVEDEERIVDAFSRGVYQVLQDNECRLFNPTKMDNGV